MALAPLDSSPRATPNTTATAAATTTAPATSPSAPPSPAHSHSADPADPRRRSSPQPGCHAHAPAPRRCPMDDSGLQNTRKRPRLHGEFTSSSGTQAAPSSSSPRAGDGFSDSNSIMEGSRRSSRDHSDVDIDNSDNTSSAANIPDQHTSAATATTSATTKSTSTGTTSTTAATATTSTASSRMKSNPSPPNAATSSSSSPSSSSLIAAQTTGTGTGTGTGKRPAAAAAASASTAAAAPRRRAMTPPSSPSRSSSPSSSPASASSPATDPPATHPENTTEDDDDNDNDNDNDNDELLSASPSASSSTPSVDIEIDVADVEDMDQDPSRSRWHSKREAHAHTTHSHSNSDPDPTATETETNPTSLVTGFPRLHVNADVQASLNEIVRILERGTPLDISAFLSVKAWLAACEEHIDLLTYDIIAKDRDFWDEVPSILEALLRRQHALLPDEGDGVSACLLEFFTSYATLTLHFVRQDSQMLKGVALDTNEEPELMSARYLSPLCWCLQLTGIPFYQALQNTQQVNVLRIVSVLNVKVVRPPLNLIHAFSGFTTLSLRLLPKCPKLVYPFITACMVVSNLVDFALEKLNFNVGQATLISPETRSMIEEAYAFFRTVDVAYQTYIAKKSSSMTSDSNEVLFKLIGNVYEACAKMMPDFALDIARALEIDVPQDTEIELLPALIRTRWRLQVLKKQIMEGRMELRVNGIDTMQADLVTLFRRYIVDVVDGAENPIIRSTVHFIKSSKMLEYIVGIDSHEQLISRGPNIVGFLIVADAYTDEDTDTLWHAVTDGQDSRVVPDVLKMLTQTFSYHQSSHALLYLCQKLLELPLHRFDLTMTDYCDKLLVNIKEKAVQAHAPDDETKSQALAIPFRLCVRLIRETPTVPELTPEQKSWLQQFASKHLASLLEMGLNDDLKIGMYKECIKDISACNDLALGSIRAVYALLRAAHQAGITRLVDDFDLTRLVINNLGKFCDSVPAENPPAHLLIELYSRIQLLNFIIEQYPQSLSADLCGFFWRKVFESSTLDDRFKNLVWDMLTRVAATAVQSQERNTFLERIFRDYLPTVTPERYTSNVLNLTTQSVIYGMTHDSTGTPAPGEVIAFPGMDQLWHIISTALPHTIEQQAIDRAIELYLDHPLLLNFDITSVQATHLALVNRCINEITAAASKLREAFSKDMRLDDDDGDEQNEKELTADELRFSRHLLFLRQLIRGLKSRPQYSAGRRQSPELPPNEGTECGQVLDINYQAYNGSSRSSVQTLRMSENCTAQQVLEKLKKVTGFTSFTTVMSGGKVNWESLAGQTVRDAGFGQHGLLMISKHPDTPTVPVEVPPDPVVREVLEHFDTLYGLLSADAKIAKEIYEFLCLFPPHQHIRAIVRDLASSEAEMLPLERPYKAIYSIVTFTYCFDEDRCAGTLDPAYTVHWVRILMSFFARHDAFPLAKEDVVRLLIARRCIEGVHHALNYYPSNSAVASSTTSLPEAGLFIDKVFDTFAGAQSCTAPTPLIGDCLAILKVKAFSVLFKAAEKGLLEWSAICEGTRLKDAVASFLLKDDRHDVRKGVANAVIDVCGRALNVSHAGDAVGDDDDDGVVGNGVATSSEDESTKVLDQIATSVWLIVADILANASEPPIPSEEFFDMAYKLFRSYVAKFPDQVELPRLLRQWGSILMNYTPHEFVGREVPDNLVLGFLRLVRTCLEVTKSQAFLEDTSQLLRPLFKTFLFPEFSDSAAEDVPEPTVPIMHEETREEIYKVFKFLCESPANYEVVMNELLGDIIPYDVTYESTAYADRTKLIRAPEGYAGLKNLSNTCYLNSLMTQLFMNVGFRKFILDAPMEGDADDADQALLFETKKLFSYLQDTWQKSVDPTDFVECIRTYDNESIDVTIQMDVDEFYNLLFDRWESQIKSEELKKSFKSIYGGQLVQQIKSKECGHVSERLEPFSAIQCDIKGKSSLEESLGAYVEGEIMQGDNKYLCSSCERHVDAVKRACLKEVPDNLIFHLKRFDFDMLMMLRNKINDEFQFPDRIDMTPYKAEYLNNPDEPIEPDMFELVGVLVHSGTAESGHYYSYIKERPLATDSTSGWVEFNDADVSRFHPSEIPNQCWGGRRDFSGNGQPLRYERAWNAYMLFYQRVSSMEEEQALFPRSPTKPAQVSLPPSLRNHIALENEIFMRTYCLMAPYHSAFVLGLLRQSRTFRNSRDEGISYAKLRKLAINVSLDHLEQLVARSKEQIDASGFLDELDLAIRESADNAVTILHWTNKRPNSIRNLLMKSYATIRIAFSRLIIACLTKLQSEIKDKSQSSSRLCYLRENLLAALEDIVAGLDRLWPNIHLFSKAWDNYFDLLIEIASFSNMGARLVLERSFLQRCMEVVLVHYEDSKRLKRSYMPYIRQLERGKNFSFIKLYELFLTLILYIDFTLPPSSDMLIREVVDGKFALTGIELDLLEYEGNTDEPLLIKRVIEQDDNKLVANSLVELIADGAAATQFEDGLQRIIAKGLSPPVRFPAPYLDAILTFCRVSPDQAKIVQLVDLAAYSTRNISDGGRQYIAFYHALMELNNVNIGRSVDWFSNLAIRRVSEWLPPLLCFPDLQVRRRALKFGEEHLIVTPEDDSPEESLGVLRSICRNLCQQCLFKLRDCTAIVANTPAQFDGSQLEQLAQFIKLCLNAYYDKDNEEDAEIARDALELISIVDGLSAEIQDEIISEPWEEQSLAASDSDHAFAVSP